MIDKKKQYALAMLSATSLIYAAGSATTVDANESTGVVTTYSLNVRSGPSTNDSRIGNVVKGQKVKILSSQNGWHQIEYNNGTGWVSGQYVSIQSSSDTSSDSTVSAGKKVMATANLNVRSGGSTSYSVISYIKKGETVEVVGTSSTGWYKVKLSNGTTGYASNQYLTESGNSDIQSPAPESPMQPGNTETIATLYTTYNLNVRSGPSTSYSSISVISKGSSVSVIEYTNSSWYKVKLSNGKIGYCSKSYLSANAPVDTPSQPETSNPDSSTTVGGYEVAKTMTVKAYAYYTGTITATGTVPTPGRTIAVDSSIIPLGSKIYIPQFDKVFIAEDRGGGIVGNKVDIFMSTRQECINWGVQNITIHILK